MNIKQWLPSTMVREVRFTKYSYPAIPFRCYIYECRSWSPETVAAELMLHKPENYWYISDYKHRSYFHSFPMKDKVLLEYYHSLFIN